MTQQGLHVVTDILGLGPLPITPPVAEVVVTKHQEPGLGPGLSHPPAVRGQELRVPDKMNTLHLTNTLLVDLPVTDEDEGPDVVLGFPHVSLQCDASLQLERIPQLKTHPGDQSSH